MATTIMIIMMALTLAVCGFSYANDVSHLLGLVRDVNL